MEIVNLSQTLTDGNSVNVTVPNSVPTWSGSTAKTWRAHIQASNVETAVNVNIDGVDVATVDADGSQDVSFTTEARAHQYTIDVELTGVADVSFKIVG